MMATRRRWSFGLRTLLLVLTIVGASLGWVGYQLNWIRERHALFNGPIPDGYGGFDTFAYCQNGFVQAPWQLRIFGERGCYQMWSGFSESDPELRRLRELFPEALIAAADAFEERAARQDNSTGKQEAEDPFSEPPIKRTAGG